MQTPTTKPDKYDDAKRTGYAVVSDAGITYVSAQTAARLLSARTIVPCAASHYGVAGAAKAFHLAPGQRLADQELPSRQGVNRE